mmetsp:Transcript_25590/g.52060  ORF Transcript_25590/g.52060 Transcript_25590/m.52060 type:complete len:83 (-) Transcript_25590:249-497(-)
MQPPIFFEHTVASAQAEEWTLTECVKAFAKDCSPAEQARTVQKMIESFSEKPASAPSTPVKQKQPPDVRLSLSPTQHPFMSP